MKTTTLDEIQRRAVAALSRYAALPKGEGDTEDLRTTANAFVDAREHFWGKDGKPDWQGRTYAYRTWVREVMSEAHVPSEVLQSIQAAIRYHSGNILRDRLDDETLEELGLQKSSPRERSIEKRERSSETLSIFGQGGGELNTEDEVLTAANVMKVVMLRLKLDDLPAVKQREAAHLLRTIARYADNLADAAGEAMPLVPPGEVSADAEEAHPEK